MVCKLNVHETSGENIIKYTVGFLSCLTNINAFDILRMTKATVGRGLSKGLMEEERDWTNSCYAPTVLWHYAGHLCTLLIECLI